MQIGSFELWPAARCLRQHGKPIAITGRAFDVLAVLAARHPDMARKSELMTAVWPGLVVEENNLQVQISLLRKILGREAIATVPGFGYCLNLAVTTCGDATGACRTAAGGGLHGRAADLAELSELVREHPLVTLSGGSGIGKSALARHLPEPPSATLARVDLADCTDTTGLLRALAGALDARGTGQPDRAALLRHLGRRPGLLVLDNADRVARLLVPVVEELLAHGAVHVLVTTQVRLHLRQEQVYRLTPLAVPPPGTSLAEALQYGALDLLAARARGHDHRFALTVPVLADAIELCRQLDGLPLALELAAARIPALGMAGLLQRMDERLTVLATGHEGVPARQRSLYDAIAWSYALLAPDEQALWCETARLQTPFSLEDLIAVGGARDIGRTLDLLGTLVERGLLRFDTGPVPCYTLEASHRQFARGILKTVVGA
ncbi:winged helix-turn-helix domain-containing protein [Pseudoduganella chitinolytica]|uniref:Winged helix-turn-helix domain-containing protein n=1 Tax=Pseudoduganella chitinolytica TaxID=34070 RepID=A0ABY8BBF7_9BURK|nr:winged helix-turn-helix domain-containing protein [Pseudoduganella chitinolytica]WEF32338.1 winged helix-turn-helix domain-containing protein [Pseudoduganella chitinolytica]